MEIFRNGKTMAKRESNRCVGMLLLGKKCHVHSRPDDLLSYNSLNTVFGKLFYVNSERFNLVKLGLFVIGFFGYKPGQAFQFYG